MIPKKNYAFISYNHQDVKMARWLHRKLESYRLPAEIHNEFEDSRYLRPVFRDQEDLNTGVLGDELRKHLENSKYLIVICSPHSAQSEWVSNEVRTFIEWGRLEYIIPFIIGGTPHSGDEHECFPKSLREFFVKHPDRELLGVSTLEVGREKAFIRVVSRMLGLNFDVLWRRHERARHRRIMAWSFGTPVALCLLWYFAVPISLSVRLQDDDHQLPMPNDAVLVAEAAEYPLNSLDTLVDLGRLPGYYRLKSVPLIFRATYYETQVATIQLGWTLNQQEYMKLRRDSTFAVFAGLITDEEGTPVYGASVTVSNVTVLTDMSGRFHISFAIEDQTETKSITIEKNNLRSVVRVDECPGTELRYIMH